VSEAPEPPGAPPAVTPTTLTGRISERWRNGGGVASALATTVLAFLMGGLVVLATGHNPIATYRAIFDGTGLVWLLPGVGNRGNAASNLQQTLIVATPLMLTGLALAFAFRCGMFNIGGQGQYLAGQTAAVLVGSSWVSLAGPAHIFLAIVTAVVAGAVWAGIAGFLKATTGAHEVISTIMLNWIAIWVADYFFGVNGPFQGPNAFNPISKSIAQNVHLPVFWGDPLLQGLDVGFFIAIGMLVVYWIILNRTTLGFEVRAVGFNPEAARYGGISTRRSYFLAMAISGAFAGLAGAVDMLGWQFQLSTPDVHASQIGFLGIAVALLGRNSAIGVFFAAILFGALTVGTSTRQLDPTVFNPELASNLTLIIQGLVVLFVGADVLVLAIWQSRKRLLRPAGRTEIG
jgi:general nucleoside transport system permease protein